MKYFNENRIKAEEYFIEQGLMPAKEDRTEIWVLHHKDKTLKDTDLERYLEWRVEDLEPMTRSEHIGVHNCDRHPDVSGEKNGMYGKHWSPETREKMKNRKSWNKGLTKESDERIQALSNKLKKPKSEETKRKISESLKGNIPWNKGLKTKGV